MMQHLLELRLLVVDDFPDRALPRFGNGLEAVHQICESDEIWGVPVSANLVVDMRRKILWVLERPLKRLSDPLTCADVLHKRHSGQQSGSARDEMLFGRMLAVGCKAIPNDLCSFFVKDGLSELECHHQFEWLKPIHLPRHREVLALIEIRVVNLDGREIFLFKPRDEESGVDPLYDPGEIVRDHFDFGDAKFVRMERSRANPLRDRCNFSRTD